MRDIFIAGILAAALCVAMAAAEQPAQSTPGGTVKAAQDLFRLWDFDKEAAGEKPKGFSPHAVGGDAVAIWMVDRDPAAPSQPHVLRQSVPCLTDGCLQVLLAEGLVYEYPDVAVRLRLLPGAAGRSAGGGGVVFGARDATHFYVAIADASLQSAEVIQVQDGKSTVLGRGPIKPKKTAWHHLRVQRNTIISKEYIEVFFDHELTVSVEGKSLESGQIGLATKGDALVAFDNLGAAPLYSHKPLSPPAAY